MPLACAETLQTLLPRSLKSFATAQVRTTLYSLEVNLLTSQDACAQVSSLMDPCSLATVMHYSVSTRLSNQLTTTATATTVKETKAITLLRKIKLVNAEM
jgi:hypothetical protein